MSVTAAAGFLAGGVAAGIKPAGELDLALVVGEPATIGAAVFTKNRAAAPPVELSRRHLAAGPSVRAVVLNSGCANAGTGDSGRIAAQQTAAAAALALRCDDKEVLVCSTGPIGPHLDPATMRRGVGLACDALGSDSASASDAAAAILTTDSVVKEAQSISDGFAVGGMAKGAGMIRPDMATMLALITTDAVMDPDDADKVLRLVVDMSFHSLNIDGCESTNDAVVLLASGASGTTASVEAMAEPLGDVCRSLARQIAADAEGASKVVRILIRGAADAATARLLGRRIADSALVRSSFFGGDPNWGRILAALGSATVPIDPDLVDVAFAGIPTAIGGVGVGFDREALVARLGGDFTVDIDVGDGPGMAEVLTTDLTPDYVAFNGEPS